MLKPLALAALFAATPVMAARPPLLAIGVEADARLVHGEAVARDPITPDQIVFFDVVDGLPHRRGSVEAPVSFMGPPAAIAISPDRRWAFAPADNGRDASAPGTLVPTDVLSVIDLAGRSPKVVQTLHLGADATAAALSPDGRLLVVTHADADRASVLRFAAGRAEKVGELVFGKGARPLAAVFLPDGHSLAITLAGSNRIALFAWRGTHIDPQPYHQLSAGVYPTSLAVCGRSGYAVVGNFGAATGDQDTVSLIDLRARPARVIDTASAGISPEGVDCSADGRHAVAANQNMSVVDPADPRYSPQGEVVLLAIRDRRLVVTDRATIGGWVEGAMFIAADLIAAQSLGDGRLHLFRRAGDRLVALDPIVFENGGPTSFGRAPD